MFDPSNNVCEQVMDLIKFMYRQYHKVDRYCITTTSTTTTSTTTASTTTEATTSSTTTTLLVINDTIVLDTTTPQTGIKDFHSVMKFYRLKEMHAK